MKRESAAKDAALARERADRLAAEERAAEMERRLAEIVREPGDP